VRVPLSWLREYVDVQLTPEQLAERLTLLGMEVKGVEAWGADWESVVVGELLAVERDRPPVQLFVDVRQQLLAEVGRGGISVLEDGMDQGAEGRPDGQPAHRGPHG
jgi:phenylalanyl-tRNA synthetase beta chain